MEVHDSAHIILYAKGHYKRTDLIEDLKILLGKRNAIYPEHISMGDIVFCLADLAYELGLVNTESRFLRFLEDASPQGCKFVGYPETEPYDYAKAIIRVCLSRLKLTDVRKLLPNGEYETILELGEADASILPLAPKVENWPLVRTATEADFLGQATLKEDQ